MITKILVFVLCFAILNVVREGFELYKGLKTAVYKISDKRLIGLGLSLAYILTIIFTGFSL